MVLSSPKLDFIFWCLSPVLLIQESFAQLSLKSGLENTVFYPIKMCKSKMQPDTSVMVFPWWLKLDFFPVNKLMLSQLHISAYIQV